MSRESIAEIALVLADVVELGQSLDDTRDDNARIVELEVGRVLEHGAITITETQDGQVEVNPSLLVSGASRLVVAVLGAAAELGLDPAEVLARAKDSLRR
ncbi:hypothetical protein ASC77_09275 [Nocardioides sp. Root1257]|uniref:hypothetical protein n=1 Tax=unclassified Nocardioides TaxID=2615069 RepID=UPI0006F6FAB6|nr:MULTISPECIES: hypothetical protein [unclassified Nocardioides]KQW48900.1 hypothetical protein ASC77_09275 [Nocardioides sp. Root1257]KRC48075.1 hypothetical protein ASE24_09280 [Nocardioides sp. Root224]